MSQQLQEPIPLAKKRLRPNTPAKDETYRLSTYALTFPKPENYKGVRTDTVRIYHTVTGELLAFDADEAKHLQGLPAKYAPWMDELIRTYFLVPQDFNEREWVDFLRHLFNIKHAKEPRKPTFVILPTTACNARCPYCFEQGIDIARMSPEVEKRTAEYIARLSRSMCATGNSNGETPPEQRQPAAHIVWYGGEPLLGAASISRICEKLCDEGIQWDSHILTNAYLVDKGLALRMRNDWKVEKALVAIDGTEAHYNRIKAFINPKDNPFKRVMQNVALLLDAGIYVHIRLNLNQENLEDLSALVSILAKEFGSYEKFSVHVSILGTPSASPASCYSHETLLALHTQRNVLIGRIKDAGLKSSTAFTGLRLHSCIAAANNSAIINPKGQLSCCYQDTSNVLGSIFDEPPAFPQHNHHVLRVPECDNCVLYPDCLRNTYCRNDCNPSEIAGRIAQIGADAWRI